MKSHHFLFLFCGAALMLVSCDRGTPSANPGHFKQVNVAVDRPPVTFDPLKVLDVNSHMVAAAGHASLALVDKDQQLKLVIAESIEMTPDGLHCTIRLRSATFWDGTSVTADDVVHSFNRIRRSGHPHRWILDRLEGIVEFDDRQTETIGGLKAVDNRTVNVAFTMPDPDFPYYIACEVASIVKRGSDRLDPSEYDRHIVGCGPFRPSEIDAGATFKFQRNEGFPFKSQIKSINFVVVENPQNQLAAVAAGEVDLVRLRGPLLTEACKSAGATDLAPQGRFTKHQVLSQDANELTFIMLNWKSKPLMTTPLTARRDWKHALLNAFNRKRMAQALYLNQAEPAQSFVPLNTSVGILDMPLSSAQNESINVPVLTLLCANDADSRRLAAYVQAEAKAAGFKFDPVFLELSQLVQRLLRGEYEASLFWIEQAVPGGPLPWLQFFGLIRLSSVSVKKLPVYRTSKIRHGVSCRRIDAVQRTQNWLPESTMTNSLGFLYYRVP
ncbi:MAG: ABC transporter substrate-binding protein [Planctomycetes bacterium]|nr:ABC transporter substrate-binding protein [Planctomycetota bacterium]